MVNSSQVHAHDESSNVNGGFPLLSLGESQPNDTRPFSLAPPAAAAATLNLSVPSLPQSHASDELTATASSSQQPHRIEQKEAATSSTALQRPSSSIEQQPSRPLADEDEDEEAAENEQSQPEQQQQQQQEEAEECDGEPTWEAVHPDMDEIDGAENHNIASSSAAIDDSFGAMALSLFDDSSQLLDDSELTLPASSATASAQRNFLSSLPAFPSLPFGLRSPSLVVPATPSPPPEGLSPAGGINHLDVAVPLFPSSPTVVPSTIAPTPPPSPHPPLPATEPVSSSSSSASTASSVSSASSAEQPASPPNLTRPTSTYSQETQPVLSLHSSSSSPSLHPTPAPPQFSQHPSMPPLEHATGDQPEIEVAELVHEDERHNTQAVRDGDGFVRPALPHRQSMHERQNGSQRASQSNFSAPHSPLRSSTPRPVQQSSPHPPGLVSPPRSAVVLSPSTPPRALPIPSAQSLASQVQSQVESQAWDLTYHYPALDAAAREQLIADRGLTTLYGQSSAVDAVSGQENKVDTHDEEEQSEVAEEVTSAADELPAVQSNNERQQSLEFDIDIDFSDHEDDQMSEQPVVQQIEQLTSHPFAESTFCSQDSDVIPQFTISAQHSFTTSHVPSPSPAAQHAASVAAPVVQSPVFSFGSSPPDSPLSPPPVATTHERQVSAAYTHVAHRTRGQLPREQIQPAISPAPLSQRHETTREDEQRDDEETREESTDPLLDRQLSIDPEHPSSDTVLLQRKLMRVIRKQQREEERVKRKPTAPPTLTTQIPAKRVNKQTSRDRHEDGRRRLQRRQEADEKDEERISTEEEEADDDDFVPQNVGKRPYSATREHGKAANKKTESRAQLNGKDGRARDTGSEEEERQVLRSSNRKRRVIASEEEEDGETDKQNHQPTGQQWKRLRKPERGDSDRSQTVTASEKKAKACERAGKLRQSSLLEHYSSTPTATPPIAVEELLEFTPDPVPISIRLATLRTPAASSEKVTSKPAITSTPAPTAPPPPLLTTVARHSSASSSSSPSRPPATVSVATRRGLVDITNTVNSRQRPPASPTKQPSNGWRTKRRKGDDGTEWEESPPSKRLDIGRQQRSDSSGGNTKAGLRRSAANVGSMRRRGGMERDIVVLDATQDPDG